MTIRTRTAAPPPAADDQALATFFDAVRSTNPFIDNRVNGPAPAELDVPDIHGTAFRELTAQARAARTAPHGIGVVLWGEAGVGKSHLLARLGRWSEEEHRAQFLYLHNLQSSPENLPRSILRSVLSQLTCGQVQQLLYTPLFQISLGLVSEALNHDMSVRHSWSKAEAAMGRLLARLGAEDAGRGFPVDRTIYEVLFRFFHSACRERGGVADGVAPLVVRWLSGDALDPEDARAIGLPVSHSAVEPVALADAEQIRQVLAALARAAACRGRPFLLCFDQVDNLDHDQAGTLTRFLQALLDGARNLVVVTAGVKATLLDFRAAKVIQDSAWDRVGQVPIDVQRIGVAEGKRLVAYRLERFFEPFLELPAVREKVQNDLLFPLGERWASEFLAGKIELRPRDVLSWAREGWRREQDHLEKLGDDHWLHAWPVGTPRPEGRVTRPLTASEIDAAIDAVVEEKLRAHQEMRRQRADTLPPDAGHLAGLLAALLGACRDGVRVTAHEASRGDPYELRMVHPLHDPERTADTGFVILTTDNARTTTARLRWIVQDRHRPQRVFVLTDVRQPLAFGRQANAQGRLLFRQLEGQGPGQFRHVALPFDEYAYLDALRAVVGMARSGEVEAELPGGQLRPVSEAEVLASHHRQGRYTRSALLRELFPADLPR